MHRSHVYEAAHRSLREPHCSGSGLLDEALTERPTASADLFVCNPLFRTGATVHAGVALRMLADARRVLKPGGELWVVFNTHLGYRDYLNPTVGPTRQAGRNSKFTVTVSVRE